MKYYGLDLGTKTGALVQLSENVSRYTIRYSWVKGPKVRDFPGLIEHGEIISNKLKGPGLMAVDWSPYETFLRGNRLAIQMKAMLFGFIYARARAQSIEAIFMTPNKVRKYFKLPPKVAKEQVHESFLSKNTIRLKTNEHELDAIILASMIRDFDQQGLVYLSS